MDFAAMESIQLSGATGFASSDLFLRRYTSAEMQALLARTGFQQHLSEKGYHDLLYMVLSDPSGISTFRVYRNHVSQDDLLVDIRVSEQRFNPAQLKNRLQIAVYDMVLVEWLLSRDASSSFRNDKNRLPAQESPGLGALSSFFKLMIIIGEDIKRDGFMAVPDHLHAAMMYGDTFSFFDPEQEGIMRALRRDLSGCKLPDIAWAHATGAIRDVATDRVFEYSPSAQVYPVSNRLRRYFRSPLYVSRMREANGAHSFVLDRRVLEKGRKAAMDEDLAAL